jgi:putative DNA primase/helicase
VTFEIHTNPAEFLKFHELLIKNAPGGYEPFYFALVPNSKDPIKNGKYDPILAGSWLKRKLSVNEAYALLKKGYNIAIAALANDPLCIVDVDDIGLVGFIKPTLVAQSRKRIGRHNFFFTTEESTYETEDAVFIDSAKDNIDTDTAGEVRANNQYVVCAGSFVECSEEEILKIPEEDKVNAGKYTVFAENDVSYITYEELPDIYKQKHESEKLAEIAYRIEKEDQKEINQDNEDSKNKSSLWTLTVPGLTGLKNNPNKRFKMFPEFHEDDSKTGGNASISGDLLHCWRHHVSHNAFTFLAVKAGLYTCNDAGRKFKGHRFGATKTPENVFKVWSYAKENKLIPDNDPIPSKALEYAAINIYKLCSKTDIIDDWKLPTDLFNKTLACLKTSGINTGRDQFTPKKGMRKAATKLISGLSVSEIVDGLQEEVPIYFDNGKNFWMWNRDLNVYERIDETEIMVQITEHLDLTIYSKDFKNQILEGIRQTGRLRRVKPTKNGWIQFKNGVFDIETNRVFEASPDYFFVSQIPHNIGNTEETPVLDKLFEDWQGDQAELLKEICAYCLIDDYPIQRIFALVGPGGNGKGQFMKFIKRLLGFDNVVGTDLDRLSDSRFEASKLFKKKAAFVGETNYTLSKTSMLKLLTGGDTISGEFKGRDPFDFVNTAKIIIATNGLPVTTDRSEGFYRRWCTIEFKNKFCDGKDIVDTVPEVEYQNFCRKAVRLIKNIIKTGKLSEPDIQGRKEQYEKLSNPIQAFLNDECKLSEEAYTPIWYLYEQYNLYREARGHRHILQNEFSKIVGSMGYTKKQQWYSSENITTYKKNQEISKGSSWWVFEGIAVIPKLGTEDSSTNARKEKESEDIEKYIKVSDSSVSSAKVHSTPYIEPDPIFTLDLLENKENRCQETVFDPSSAYARNARIHENHENNANTSFIDFNEISAQETKESAKVPVKSNLLTTAEDMAKAWEEEGV